MKNWRELPAGRELDRVVAEAAGIEGDAPHYSTDLNDAFTLVDSYFKCQSGIKVNDDIVWEVSINLGKEVRHDSLAMAIVQGYLAYEEAYASTR